MAAIAITITARILTPGTAQATTLVLSEPLSFWGGYDPATGVIRHVDAGYERAVDVADERGVRIPMADTP